MDSYSGWHQLVNRNAKKLQQQTGKMVSAEPGSISIFSSLVDPIYFCIIEWAVMSELLTNISFKNKGYASKAETWWHWQCWYSIFVGSRIWVKNDSESTKSSLRLSLISLERHNNSCITIHARMFSSYIKMSNIEEAVKSSATLLRNGLSTLTPLGLLLSRGCSVANRGGTRSAEGFDSTSVGLITSYYFKYFFLTKYHWLWLICRKDNLFLFLVSEQTSRVVIFPYT